MEPYRHTVQYYETDKMGITHHSNYIRWMEEARTDFLKQLGWGYERLEAEGIVSPVTRLDCKYIASTTFPETITIELGVSELKGAVLKLDYVMWDPEGKKVFEAHSAHCFLRPDGKLVRLKTECPGLYARLAAFLPAGEGARCT